MSRRAVSWHPGLASPSLASLVFSCAPNAMGRFTPSSLRLIYFAPKPASSFLPHSKQGFLLQPENKPKDLMARASQTTRRAAHPSLLILGDQSESFAYKAEYLVLQGPLLSWLLSEAPGQDRSPAREAHGIGIAVLRQVLQCQHGSSLRFPQTADHLHGKCHSGVSHIVQRTLATAENLSQRGDAEYFDNALL